MAGLGDIHDMILDVTYRNIAGESQNPLMRTGESFFSQVDEDGITSEILNRIASTDGNLARTFVELGVGDGTENNTLILAARGWRGMWFGGQDLSYQLAGAFQNRLEFNKVWITRQSLETEVLPKIRLLGELDVLSLDLDGNDWYFCKQLLESGTRPKLWIQEYNAMFPSDVNWCIPYDALHTWDVSSYFGASLLAYVDLFEEYGYRLVVCNVTGVNAFFVRNDFASLFDDVPKLISELYMPSRPWLYRTRKKLDPRAMAGFR
jgi:hypothetical protein